MLTDDQLREIRAALNSADNPKINKANFETMIDVAVNKQAPLKECRRKLRRS